MICLISIYYNFAWCINLEKYSENITDKSVLMKKYYKPDFSILFNRIKGIRRPVKNDLIIALLDGCWHSERDLVRLSKRQRHLGGHLGPVTLGTMFSSLNHMLKSNYVERQFIDGEMHYKITDNYVGLSRAAYNKFRFTLK